MSNPFDCISEFIFVETEIKKADLILIPGGSHPQLMERAVELYNKGFAPYILPSGGANKNLPHHKSEWDYLKMIAIKSGIPDRAILKENKAQNTFENAELSLNVMQTLDMPIKNVILVCKAFHSRRALLTYQSVFPQDINFYVSSVIDKRGISKESWFFDEKSIRIVMSETSKIGNYFKDKILIWQRGENEETNTSHTCNGNNSITKLRKTPKI